MPRSISHRLAFIAFSLVACARHPQRHTGGTPPQAPNTAIARPDIAHGAAVELAASFQRVGVPATVNEDTVHALDHTVQFTAALEQTLREADHTTVAINVALRIDGTPYEAFHNTAIGIDASESEAVERAVREWNVGYGIPTVDAMRGAYAATRSSTGGTAGLTLGTFAVYPGPTGVRGEVPETWSRGTPEMHRAFLGRFAGAPNVVAATLGPETFHSIKILLHVRNGAAGEGDCRVDNVRVAALCDLARSYEWPQGPEEYVFRQYYVLTRLNGP